MLSFEIFFDKGTIVTIDIFAAQNVVKILPLVICDAAIWYLILSDACQTHCTLQIFSWLQSICLTETAELATSIFSAEVEFFLQMKLSQIIRLDPADHNYKSKEANHKAAEKLEWKITDICSRDANNFWNELSTV